MVTYLYRFILNVIPQSGTSKLFLFRNSLKRKPIEVCNRVFRWRDWSYQCNHRILSNYFITFKMLMNIRITVFTWLHVMCKYYFLRNKFTVSETVSHATKYTNFVGMFLTNYSFCKEYILMLYTSSFPMVRYDLSKSRGYQCFYIVYITYISGIGFGFISTWIYVTYSK